MSLIQYLAYILKTKFYQNPIVVTGMEYTNGETDSKSEKQSNRHDLPYTITFIDSLQRKSRNPDGTAAYLDPQVCCHIALITNCIYCCLGNVPFLTPCVNGPPQ
jgi:hypothetical protein